VSLFVVLLAWQGAAWSFQSRVEREVDATFAFLRTTIGNATHGRVETQLWSRSIRIADIVLLPIDGQKPSLKIAEFVATGITLLPTERFSANRVEASNAEFTIDSNGRVHIESITLEHFSFSPSQVKLAEVFTRTTVAPEADPTSLIRAYRAIADAWQDVKVGNAEGRALRMVRREGVSKLASIRLAGADNGHLAEFVFQDLEVEQAGKAPTRLKRLALEGPDMVNLIKKSVQFTTAIQAPPRDQTLLLLPLLQAVQLEGLNIPEGGLRHFVSVDFFRASWGQFVNSVPSIARLTVRMSGPLGTADPGPFKMLADAGYTMLSLNIDIGTEWTEKTQTLVVAPAVAELGHLFSVSGNLSLGKVSLESFVIDAASFEAAARLISVGTIAFSIHDLGGIDLSIRQAARTANVSSDAMRRRLIENMTRNVTAQSSANPDIQRLVDAIVRFIERSGYTLSIELTPKGDVSAVLALEAFKRDPFSALSQFALGVRLVP